MENDLEAGLSLADFWSAIKKRIWLVLGTAAACAIAAVLIFMFVLNPRMERYQMAFTLSYIGSENRKYPDGAPFYTQDFISLEHLARAKASDAGFAQIDLETILEKDDIEIEYRADQGRYVLSIKRSYFENSKQATEFLRAVAEVPAMIVKEKGSFDWQTIDEKVYESASFEDKLSLLSAQRDSLLGIYDGWIEALHENYMVGGKTLNVYRTETAVIFGDALREEMTLELKKYGYKSLEELPGRLVELQAEKNLNESKLENLTALLEHMLERQETATSAESVSEMIAELIVRNLEIDSEIEWLNEENTSAFGVRIDAEYNKLAAAGETLSGIAKELYQHETRMFFYTSSAETEGGMSLILVGGGAFVVVLLIAGAIATYKGFAEQKAANAKEPETRE